MHVCMYVCMYVVGGVWHFGVLLVGVCTGSTLLYSSVLPLLHVWTLIFYLLLTLLYSTLLFALLHYYLQWRPGPEGRQ
jgi:hypothetical protein